MSICENPRCGKEHNGSYGSGRFCSAACAHSYVSSLGLQRAIKNGTFKSNLKIPKAKEGGWTCRFCNAKFRTRKEMNEHKRREHSSMLNSSKKFGWSKGLTKETSKSIAKAAKTHKQHIEDGTIVHSWTGKHHSESSKEKQRKAAISFIQRTKNFTNPRFNPRGCDYMDKLNESKGWHLQHGRNGGEKYVGGYWLDGYDKELNIAFEYDESGHYLDCTNNILHKHDIERMNYIHEKLGCRFFRYNEKMNYLYEVSFS